MDELPPAQSKDDDDDDDISSKMITTTTTTSSLSSSSSSTLLRVVFIHLDWGIGGAEQLMLQLCTATKQMENTTTTTTSTTTNSNNNTKKIDMHLVTSYCNPNHCFELLRPPMNSNSSNNSNNTSTTSNSNYYQYLKIYGAWIPSHILYHKGKALMSTIRLLYLALRVIHHTDMCQADLIVVDVLPIPLLLLYYCCPNASLLFYCHFPDQLLTRSTSNSNSYSYMNRCKNKILQWYRSILNTLEEQCMMYADMITVNSKFTQQTVRHTFTSLSQNELPILYPALEIMKDHTNNMNHHHHHDTSSSKIIIDETTTTTTTTTTAKPNNKKLIVSLNRFERKKNLGLLIEAMAWIQDQQQQTSTNSNLLLQNVHVIIAGGYDPKNIENIEYHLELQQLVQQLQVQHLIEFRFSITDIERNELLQNAMMVIYTPSYEHFGIVPLEAMYAYTPVIACNNGGPMETIRHHHTGYLCDPTPISFGTSIMELLVNPQRAIQMGQAGHEHVLQNFSPFHLAQQWEQIVQQTLQKGYERRRCQKQQSILLRYIYRIISPRTILYLFESFIMLSFIICFIYILQYIFVVALNGSSSIWNYSTINGILFQKTKDEL